jgi:hypothetical protein
MARGMEWGRVGEVTEMQGLGALSGDDSAYNWHHID